MYFVNGNLEIYIGVDDLEFYVKIHNFGGVREKLIGT